MDHAQKGTRPSYVLQRFCRYTLTPRVGDCAGVGPRPPYATVKATLYDLCVYDGNTLIPTLRWKCDEFQLYFYQPGRGSKEANKIYKRLAFRVQVHHYSRIGTGYLLAIYTALLLLPSLYLFSFGDGICERVSSLRHAARCTRAKRAE